MTIFVLNYGHRMKGSLLFLSFLTILVFLSCKEESGSVQDDVKPFLQTYQVPKNRLYVTTDYISIRETPGTEGETLGEAKKGEFLYNMNEVSNFTTRMTLRGLPFDEPWIKIVTPKGIVGWVYGGAVHYPSMFAGEAQKALMERRFTTIFGKELLDTLHRINIEKRSFTTAQEVADAFLANHAFAQQLEKRLDKALIIKDPMDAPDLFWLDDWLPGLAPTLMSQRGTRFCFFDDFAYWLPKVKHTPKQNDDKWLEIALQLYPVDSISYTQGAFYLETGERDGYSLLGNDIHFSLLKKMNQEVLEESPFTNIYIDWKKEIVQDITSRKTKFWNAKEAILPELDSILMNELPILSKEDQISLSTTRKLLENPRRNKIVVNGRNGNG